MPAKPSFDLQVCQGHRGSCRCRLSTTQPGITDQWLDELLEEAGFDSGRPAGIPDVVPGSRHRRLKIAVADCPNGCSRPWIMDLGLIRAAVPAVSLENCSGCGECAGACREDALPLRDGLPELDSQRCLSCGACIPACPVGCITRETTGFRIVLGGRLGRHPRLAVELPELIPDERLADFLAKLFRQAALLHDENSRWGDSLLRAAGVDGFSG